MSEIRFTVLGVAKTAGSKRGIPIYRGSRADGSRHFTGHVAVIDASKRSRDWKTDVTAAARQAYAGPILEGPLAVEFVFFVLRPVGHSGKRGLSPSAPAFPATRPDVLKLSRAVEDALTGIVWRDDAQVVVETLRKEYGQPARVEVVIRQLPMTASEAGLVAAAAPRPEVEPLFAEAVR